MIQKKAAAVAAIICCLLIIFTCMSMTGCARPEQGPKALAILYVNAQGREVPDVSNTLVEEKVYQAIRSGGEVCVINVDGEPERSVSRSYALDERYSGASKSRLNADAASAAAALLEECRGLKADDPEIDLLGALELASHTLATAVKCTEKTVLVMDTGLSTCGELDFRNNLICAEPEELADLLEERCCIPDLKGVEVLWLMTDPAGGQTISQAQAGRIEAIWKAIAERGGAAFSCKKIGTGSKSSGAGASYPEVSVVRLPKEQPIRFDAEAVTEDPDVFQEPQFLSEEQVRFVPDSAEYLNAAEAEATLRPVADYLKEHPSVTLLLAGTIAGDTCGEQGVRLSKARAETVRDTLLSLGVSESQLVVRGLGCSDPWHIYGVGTSGSAAAKNRKVVLLDASTEQARRLLAD